MALCASLSFARFLSSCAAERVETLRVPALEARFDGGLDWLPESELCIVPLGLWRDPDDAS